MSLYFVCHSHFQNSSTTKKIVPVFGFIALIYLLLSTDTAVTTLHTERKLGTEGTLGTVETEGTLGNSGKP